MLQMSDGDGAGGAVDRDDLAVGQGGCGSCGAHDCGEAVFAGDDGGVGETPSGVGDDGGGEAEQGCP